LLLIIRYYNSELDDDYDAKAVKSICSAAGAVARAAYVLAKGDASSIPSEITPDCTLVISLSNN
jgi:hypothetical protein